MVRPLSKEEKSELDQLFGGGATGGAGGVSLSSGGVFGSGGSLSTATGGGKFSGETMGTGFVNAGQYLDANQGKGAALGEKITEGAGKAQSDISGAISDFKSADPGVWAPPKNSAADETLAWDTGKGGPKKTSKDYEAAENWYASREGAYSGNGSDIDRKYGALQDLKGMGESWKTKLDPNASDARVTRSGLLKDTARSSGLYGYGDNAQAFDSMFMEAESPDLISRKHKALESALSGYAGLDTLLAGKKDQISANQAASDSYYSQGAQKAKELKEATAARENSPISNKVDQKGDLIPGEAESTTRESTAAENILSSGGANGKPIFGGGGKTVDVTTHPDGTKEEFNKLDGTRTTTYPDGSRTVTSRDGVKVEYNADGSIKKAAGGFT